MKFYTFTQNNSGGYYIVNETVNAAIIIEAASESEAVDKFSDIVEDHHEYCECCGTRWSFYPDEADTPLIYGDKPEDSFWTPVIHYANGDVVTVERKR